MMNFDWIERGVLLAGSRPARAGDVAALREQGIAAIITLTEVPVTEYVPPDALSGMTCFHIPVDDFKAPRADQVRDAAALIDRLRDAGTPAYLHCYAGQGRTGTMLHGCCLLRGMTLDAARLYVQARRPTAAWDFLSEEQQTFLRALATGKGWYV